MGYPRLHGELLVLGVTVAASTVWEVLKEAGIDPSPERNSSTWADFLCSQAEALLACDFFETVTLTGTRLYVFAVIEHGSRRIRILGATAHPTAAWVAQAAKNLVMDLEDARCRARFLLRDRDGKFPALFDAILDLHSHERRAEDGAGAASDTFTPLTTLRNGCRRRGGSAPSGPHPRHVVQDAAAFAACQPGLGAQG